MSQKLRNHSGGMELLKTEILRQESAVQHLKLKAHWNREKQLLKKMFRISVTCGMILSRLIYI